jgi:hypothetical protein
MWAGDGFNSAEEVAGAFNFGESDFYMGGAVKVGGDLYPYELGGWCTG